MKNIFLKLFFLIQLLTLLSFHLKGQHSVPWSYGYLDIHHISTGRGNSTFCIFPDGTTLLIDAGDMSELHQRVLSNRQCPMRPDNSKTAPQRIAEYIAKVYPSAMVNGIDYALITHYHDDHFGEADSSRKISGNGYLLTGITEVGTIIKIHNLIDRGNAGPVDLNSNSFRNTYWTDEYHLIQTLDEYYKFIVYQTKANNLNHQQYIPGSGSQLLPVHKPEDFSNFFVRNLFGNGKIWYGGGDSCFRALPDHIYPGENPLSLGIKITYGKFDYYTGGDISGMDGQGQTDYSSMEAKAAPIIGAVDVATLNHHGNRDSQSPLWISCLRPRVWVQQSWSADHPGEEVFRRLISRTLYPGDRDLYSTCFCDANKTVIGPAVDKTYIATEGHIVIRVNPDGNTYSVIVTDDKSYENNIKSIKNYAAK